VPDLRNIEVVKTLLVCDGALKVPGLVDVERQAEPVVMDPPHIDADKKPQQEEASCVKRVTRRSVLVWRSHS
jgi:hypothetical protein